MVKAQSMSDSGTSIMGYQIKAFAAEVFSAVKVVVVEKYRLAFSVQVLS